MALYISFIKTVSSQKKHNGVSGNVRFVLADSIEKNKNKMASS